MDRRVPILERMGERVAIEGWEGQETNGKEFPCLQRLPAPKAQQYQRRDGVVSEIAEGREKQRERPNWGGRD